MHFITLVVGVWRLLGLLYMAECSNDEDFWNRVAHSWILYSSPDPHLLLWTHHVDSNQTDGRFGSSGKQGFFTIWCIQMARKNTLKTFLLISICFVLCWTCTHFNYLLYNIGYAVDFNGAFHKIVVLLAFCNCTINPFVYLFKYKDYKTAVRELFHIKQTQKYGQSSKIATIASTISN